MISLYKFQRRGDGNATWDRKYTRESAQKNHAEDYRMQPFVQTMLRYLPVAARILDAGCGTGGLLLFLKQRGGDVTGIDTSPVAIETLKRLAPHIHAQVASIEELPFPNASFEAYAAIGSWEYPPAGPDRSAREAARVLKNGGFAFIEVPQTSLLRRLIYSPLKRLEYVWKTAQGKKPEFAHHLFTQEDLKALLHQHGFDVLEIHPHDLPEPNRHYGLWVDWPFVRRGSRYELNTIGKIIKAVGNTISPWTIATGMFIVARKR